MLQKIELLSVDNLYGQKGCFGNSFKVSENIENNCLIIRFEQLNANVDFVENLNKIAEEINFFKYRLYILDLSSAFYIDSLFLGTLIMLFKKISRFGGKYSLIIDYNKMKLFKNIFIFKNLFNIKCNIQEVIKENL